MPIHYVAGDLLQNRHALQAFAHGCNLQGLMGAGIAVQFRERFPAMYAEYRRRCKVKPREFNLGDVFAWQEAGQPIVYNLGTQVQPGRGATYAAVTLALREMKRQADAQAVKRIGMPRIAAGYGGLSWKKVKAIVETVFQDWAGDLFVYEEYVPGQ